MSSLWSISCVSLEEFLVLELFALYEDQGDPNQTNKRLGENGAAGRFAWCGFPSAGGAEAPLPPPFWTRVPLMNTSVYLHSPVPRS